MRVNVTRKHISAGKRGESQACPIACAVRESLEETDGVDVQHVTVNDDSLYVSYTVTRSVPLSAKAQKFVSTFDNLGKGKPLTLNLNVGL